MDSCDRGSSACVWFPTTDVFVQDEFLRQCEAAPPGTFGSEYHNFMSKRSFRADARPPVRFVDDAELAYVATRYRQVHDFWHVLFACNTSLLGETTLKALEFSQVRFTTDWVEACCHQG